MVNGLLDGLVLGGVWKQQPNGTIKLKVGFKDVLKTHFN